MATPVSTAAPQKQLHIDALTSAVPSRVTEPGLCHRISVDAPLHRHALKSHFRLVLYYEKAGEEAESASEVAAWIKESLSLVLPDHPLLAGRLQKDHESDGYWEVKFNDAGVRLVQATADATLAEFLASEDRDGGEDMLAYWVDVDSENPQFSALFYVQVTEFQGDGYSIGISCSLLLADPLFMTRFLRTWSLAHTKMITQAQFSSLSSLFLLGNFRRLNSTPLFTTSPGPTTTTTTLFKLGSATDKRALASLYVEEATKWLKGTAVSELVLITSDHSGDLKVELCNKEWLAKSDFAFKGALNVVRWDELGAEELVFGKGDNKPVYVSYRIVSGGLEGLAVAMLPSHDQDAEELIISVTVTKMI